MPYKSKDKCVYRADTGKKVGCTNGPVKKYLAALHANVPDAKDESVNESANVPTNYQSAISAVATEFVRNAGNRANLSEYSPAEVIAIIYGIDVNKARDELKLRIQQKLTKAQSRGIHESTCRCCGGDGWYVEPDEKGEPKQVQCSSCQGQGGEKEPEPTLRPSGEPFSEVKSVSYNGGLPQEEDCPMCGVSPCKCMSLTEIIKKIR